MSQHVDAIAYARRIIARDLRAARVQAGLTQAQLARKLRRTQAVVSQAETGHASVGERYVLAVLKACGLPPDWRQDLWPLLQLMPGDSRSVPFAALARELGRVWRIEAKHVIGYWYARPMPARARERIARALGHGEPRAGVTTGNRATYRRIDARTWVAELPPLGVVRPPLTGVGHTKPAARRALSEAIARWDEKSRELADALALAVRVAKKYGMPVALVQAMTRALYSRPPGSEWARVTGRQSPATSRSGVAAAAPPGRR